MAALTTQALSTGHTRASTKAGVAALFTRDEVFATCETALMSVGASRRITSGCDLECAAFRQRLGSRPLQTPPHRAGETRVYAPFAPSNPDTGHTSG
jgi:hypothetical protein